MKKIVLLSVIVMFLFSCGSQKAKQQDTTAPVKVSEVTVLSVDELMEKASDLADKEIVVKGTVMHVCKHGGQRCFLMGSNEEMNIRIEAGEKIGTFSQELMGSDVEIVGILTEVKTEADAHNPAKEHGEEHEGEEHAGDAESEEAHKIIADAQEAVETVYFVKGLKYKEVKSE